MSPDRVYDGDEDFDERVLAGLAAIPFFRAPTDEEVRLSFAAYRPHGGADDAAKLVEVWRTIAQPTRATVTGFYGALYASLGRLPSTVMGLSFLATLRAVLGAGVGFRATLSAPIREALEEEFPWLMHRHEHVPPGPSPVFAFPDGFREFLDGAPSLDDARARWQLIAAQNEVQQSVYSRWLADYFSLPELTQHAERERALAVNYFAHWSPCVTERLWRQCLVVLDALNARVFEMTCIDEGPRLLLASVGGAFTRRAEWRSFVDALSQPQRLLAPPPAAVNAP